MEPPLLHLPTLEELDQLDDDGSLMTELLEAFEGDGHATLADLHRAAAAGDLAAIARLSHRMKSGAANMGARRIAERCRDLEEAARDGRAHPYADRVARLAQDLDDTIRALRARR